MEQLQKIIQYRILQWMANIGSWGFTASIIGLLFVIGIFYHYSHDLPDAGKLTKYEPPIVTRLYADNGQLLAEYAKEHRLYLPLEAIPRRLIEAFLSAEDKNFYEHSGIDFMSVARAILVNLNNITEKKALVGGSTITQQVVKNFLLSNEQSLERKVKEAILALRISRNYSKDRILELYLNEIYLGMRSYGVGAAAMNYFNKSVEELTIAESAYLAALPKGPANYHPLRHYDRAKARRDWVIKRMIEDGHITAEEGELAMSSPITIAERAKTDIAQAEFFAESVRRKLAEMYGSHVLYEGGLFVKTTLDPQMQRYADIALRHALVEYDRRHGYRGPLASIDNFDNWRQKLRNIAQKTPLFDQQTLAVVTKVTANNVDILTMDSTEGFIPLAELKWARRYISSQRMGPVIKKASDVLYRGDIILVEPVREGDKDANNTDKSIKTSYRLLQIPAVNGAFVAMDPHTGKVLAMSGGYSALDSEFNRATQAKRQPGSAFKPFVYLAGLERGFTPATLIMDAPISIPQGPGKPNWTPQNYSGDFLGNVTMRMGLEKSRNVMTVHLASMLGIQAIREIGQRFGIYKDMPPQYSAVLGALETDLLSLVNAYAMLVNGGKRITPALIERIDDRYGKTIYRRDKRICKNCQLADGEDGNLQKTPPIIEDNRETVVDEATAYQMVHMLEGVVQRGTAIRARKLNIPLGGKTGTTNDSRDAWFIGFSPDLVAGIYVGYDKPQPLGPKETGSSVALPGFIKFMELATKDKPPRPFRIPAGIQMVKIDRWTGQMPSFGTDPRNIIIEAFKSYERPTYTANSRPVKTRQYDSPYKPDPNWPGYESAISSESAIINNRNSGDNYNDSDIYYIPAPQQSAVETTASPDSNSPLYSPSNRLRSSWNGPVLRGSQTVPASRQRYTNRYRNGIYGTAPRNDNINSTIDNGTGGLY